MSVRDLLTFNFFLQFADGLVSYQAFALGAAEAQSRSGRCNGKLGHDWGANLQQTLACVLLLLIFAFRRNQRSLAKRALTVTASVYVCAIIVFLWQLLRYTGGTNRTPLSSPCFLIRAMSIPRSS
jgi:hypothetical protein